MRSHYLSKYKDHRWGIANGSFSKDHLRHSRTLQIFQCLAGFQRGLCRERIDRKNVTEWKSANKQQQKQQQAKETKKHSPGGVPVKTLFFITFIILGGAVYSDVQTSGSWKDSNTAYLMQKYHVCEYSHKVLNKTSESIRWVNLEIDKQFPGYEKKLHETLEPYSEMISDVGIMSYNLACNAKVAIVDGFGIIADKIEKQAPGLLEQTGEAIKLSLSTIAAYTKKGVNYLRDDVFVGKMSPENMGRVVVEALNATQHRVNEFYVWAYERVRTVIK